MRPDYYYRLTQNGQEVPSLTDAELHLACLIKLKMSNGHMADALGIAPASVARLKLRLKDRLSHALSAFDRSLPVEVWLWEF